MKKNYNQKSELWLWPGESANWHFLSISKKDSVKIKKDFKNFSRGFGSLPVLVRIGKTEWKTSIFPDKKSQSYILPVKAKVRIEESLMRGGQVSFSVKILP